MSRSQPPVVLVHGWGSTGDRTWAASWFVTQLQSAGREVVLIDLPGHGAAGGSHNPSDYADYAEQVAEVLPDAQIDAVGFSLGGKMMLRLAATAPDRFRHLVIAGVGSNLFAPERGGLIGKSLLDSPGKQVSEPLAEVITEARASGGDLNAIAAVVQREDKPITPAALGHVKADVLLVTGALDKIAVEPNQLVRALPCAESLMLPGVGHSDLPRTKAFARVATTFLTRVRV